MFAAIVNLNIPHQPLSWVSCRLPSVAVIDQHLCVGMGSLWRDKQGKKHLSKSSLSITNLPSNCQFKCSTVISKMSIFLVLWNFYNKVIIQYYWSQRACHHRGYRKIGHRSQSLVSHEQLHYMMMQIWGEQMSMPGYCSHTFTCSGWLEQRWQGGLTRKVDILVV